MPIVRTYACDNCEREWDVTCESNDPDPECEVCAKVLQWQPGLFAITGHKAKAIDYTQQIIEQDFGLSDLKDNTREGEAAYKEPAPETTSQKDKIAQAVHEYARSATAHHAGNANPPAGNSSFNWGTQPSGAPAPQVSMQHMLAQAKAGPQYPDRNPMKVLQDGIRAGHLKTPTRIVGKWRP